MGRFSRVIGGHPDFRGVSADVVARAADASLARLRVDHIDLYYVPDEIAARLDAVSAP